MVFDGIEQLKQQYTDKYVVVDATRPELARFGDQVGRVKTVNMNGRALVEFLDYHKNVGWYDIDLAYLKLVAKPETKEARGGGEAAAVAGAKQKATKAPTGKVPAAGEKKLSPLELARSQGAASKASREPASTAEKKADAKKLSPLELARSQGAVKKASGGAAPATEKADGGKKLSPLELARAQGAAKKPAGGKPSTADILAAARAGKAAAPQTEQPGEAASAAEQPAQTPEPPAAPPAKPSAKTAKQSMSVGEIVAWCREHDAK